MTFPPRQGLYDPDFERDACGLGFVATLKRAGSHEVIAHGLEILQNLTHRGAAGCDPCTGDGAGILIQIPHELYDAERRERGLGGLPARGDYAVAMCFLPTNPAQRRQYEAVLEASVTHHGQRVLGWRDVPVEPGALGPVARSTMPRIRQLFIGRVCEASRFEQTLFMIRKRAGRTLNADDFYVCSCSSRTVVYKGLMLAEQLGQFYPDLCDKRALSRLALVHSRFSTNTFPSWQLAHPFRLLAHNGEINTLRGNRTWMEAREWLLSSEVWGQHIEDFRPIIRRGGSDSAALDNVADFLVASGRSLPHVMMMLVPEAWVADPTMSDEKKAFYEYHGCLVEPWDGPAALCFTDGVQIGATLDRNGLRPAKYAVTSDGLVVLASEFGVLELDPTRITQKGRLQPGKMFLVDVEEGRIVGDDEIKHLVAARKPYRRWLDANKVDLKALAPPEEVPSLGADEAQALRRVFGYSQEDLRMLLAPMAQTGEEPIGSMGVDIPLAVLSDKPQTLFRYFKQHFAQVTNPPIDPIREEIVMSLVSCVGGEGNLLVETPRQCRMLELPHPLLTDEELARLKQSPMADFRAITLSTCFSPEGDPEAALRDALDALRAAARAAVRSEASCILVLSDRDAGPGRVPMPCLLALGAVNRDLMAAGLRARTGLIVESGEPREVAHIALLVGYGAGAVNPYLALHTASELAAQGVVSVSPEKAAEHFIKSLKKGLLKVMSKMGISTLSSYQGAQIFEAVGVDQVVINEYFAGTASRLRGVGLRELASDARALHRAAYEPGAGALPAGGHLHFRVGGERHQWNPETVAALQKAARLDDARSYEEFARLVNEPSEHPATLRGLWDLRPAGAPVPLSEVEPAKELVRRFATGAMSFGSISKEAHENLAIAMNRIGARSNTGEGGEDGARYVPDERGDSRRSAIKQVASGRFGVTAHYLVNADELQIKIAQGAKPGEGGQLPGYKVDGVIARVRHSIAGVTLISPPPHHDIYSIEDLAQLIFDLKNVNPQARVSVKLVAEAGVGTIAAGVAKAHADVILISGHDGGTGASPLTSIHHAGLPWELGLAEAQQVLVMNGLRGRVRLQADGHLKTGRDVLVAALLGAEEFGFATAPLVASGCILMRKCHLNTCPVGVATQDPELRRRFQGKPEHVINYLFLVAEEMRALMASLGFRRVDELVGRVDCIVPRTEGLSARARRVDFSEVLYQPPEASAPGASLRCTEAQDHNLRSVLDHTLIQKAKPALEKRQPVRLQQRVRNSDRAIGAMLSGEVARRHGDAGLPRDTITVDLQGSAGQSFGAWLASGVSLSLEGDANDYVGKGLCGGVVAVHPPEGSPFWANEQVIVGNTVLYGATSGEAYFNGRAGERFAVRNSGALTVVEGVGDHGCEYMTGGVVVVLGPTGRNFGAGMSGGVAVVLDEGELFSSRCHPEVRGAVEPLTVRDAELVAEVLREHVRRTRSELARRLLASWPRSVHQLVKLVPREFRAALEAQSPDARPSTLAARLALSERVPLPPLKPARGENLEVAHG